MAWFDKKDVAVRNQLLADFPWLWAVKRSWGSSVSNEVRINQDVSDLKTVLSMPSTETHYSVWCFFRNYMESMWVREIKPVKDQRWFEAIMDTTQSSDSIMYIVTATEHYKGGITIFRHPGKIVFNDLVEQVARLHGSGRGWNIVLDV